MTVFTTSQFVQRDILLSAYLDEQVNQVTALRRAEDQRFADATGLRLDHVGSLDAPLRGRGLTDHSMVPIDAAALEARLLGSIERSRVAAPRHLRPWIFCPMGIGGHIDHLTVCRVILNNLDFLQENHRVAFYEELPYAADPQLRHEGVRRFMSSWHGRRLERRVLQFAGATQKKLNLVRIYGSQFSSLPPTIARFEPAQISLPPPCECVWTD